MVALRSLAGAPALPSTTLPNTPLSAVPAVAANGLEPLAAPLQRRVAMVWTQYLPAVAYWWVLLTSKPAAVGTLQVVQVCGALPSPQSITALKSLSEPERLWSFPSATVPLKRRPARPDAPRRSGEDLRRRDPAQRDRHRASGWDCDR